MYVLLKVYPAHFDVKNQGHFSPVDVLFSGTKEEVEKKLKFLKDKRSQRNYGSRYKLTYRKIES